MVIRAIVYAEKEADAQREGKRVFDALVEKNCFDYYATFEDYKGEMCRVAIWGKIPAAALAESKEGKFLIEEAMKYMDNAFERNIELLKNNLKDKTIDELKLDKMTRREEFGKYGVGFRYICYCIGQYEGSEVFLYDNEGEGIRDKEHLQNVLSKWDKYYKTGKSPYDNKKVWVVPADVHY